MGALKRLTVEQMAFFETEGYLVVNDMFLPEDLQPVRREMAEMIDVKVRQLIEEGTLAVEDSFPNEGFDTRLARIAERNREASKAIIGSLEGNLGGGYTGKALFETITHRKLIEIIEDFVGSEIVGSSVYRVRPKLPKNNRGIVPWHQDSGYFMPHCDKELIITCWLPLVNATQENGCLTFQPRAHKGEISKHYRGGNAGFLEIKEEDLPIGGEPVVVPVPMGGAVFFTNRTPHCSTPNDTEMIRWSLDLRYQSADVPNNIGLQPEDFSLDRPQVQIACYPPEADFVIKSVKNPDKVIRTFEQFRDLRAIYESRFNLEGLGSVRDWPNHT
jgi:phytanoyl-CoA hydroxylase